LGSAGVTVPEMRPRPVLFASAMSAIVVVGVVSGVRLVFRRRRRHLHVDRQRNANAARKG